MKTKKLLSLTLTLIIILSVIVITPTASAVTLKSGNYEYKLLDDGTVSIVNYLGKYGKKVDLRIPSKLEGKKVTQLGKYIFWDKNFNTVTIPDTVTKIHSYAFDYCSFKNFVIGKNIKSFNITNVHISNKVISKNKRYKVVDKLVYNSNKTKLLYCPKKIKLNNYKLPNSVKSIEPYAFTGCINVKSINFNNVTKIKKLAFHCSSIKSVSISKKITFIGYATFADCDKLVNLKVNANKKLKISDMAFASSKIETLNVPKVTGDYVFFECEQLTKIVIPSNIKTIYREEFFDCTKLKTVTIPPTVTRIGKHAFGFRSPDSKYESNYNLINGFTIKGVKGSAAEKYAKANKIKFVAIKW